MLTALTIFLWQMTVGNKELSAFGFFALIMPTIIMALVQDITIICLVVKILTQ